MISNRHLGVVALTCIAALFSGVLTFARVGDSRVAEAAMGRDVAAVQTLPSRARMSTARRATG
jgi:hypothetical protein